MKNIFLNNKTFLIYQPIICMKDIKIEMHDYTYECGDGCCTDMGTLVRVDGVLLEGTEMDSSLIVTKILTHLGYNVDMQLTDDYS